MNSLIESYIYSSNLCLNGDQGFVSFLESMPRIKE